MFLRENLENPGKTKEKTKDNNNCPTPQTLLVLCSLSLNIDCYG